MAGYIGKGQPVSIDDNAVETVDIQDDAVTNAKIATNAVTGDSIAANAVGNSELSDNAVNTAEVADGAITAAKIDSGVELGGPSLGASSVIRTNAQTISENITIPSTSNGMSAGPITIADSYTITVSGNWSII
jgi:hypothetical protein